MSDCESATEPAFLKLPADPGHPAWRPLFGLPTYVRSLLAAHHAGLAPLYLVAEDDATLDRARSQLQQDDRLHQVALGFWRSDEWTAPIRGVELPPDRVTDPHSVQRLATSSDPASGDGLWLEADLPAPTLRRRVLRTLGNPADGLVDRWLNRPLSRCLTPLLWRLTPNTLTVLSALVGLVGVYLLASGRYGLAVAGALLFQLSAALDCVDGEVARVTYRFSPLGARLDLALDNLVHLVLFAALGHNAIPELGPGWAFGFMGLALVGGALAFAQVFATSFSEGGGSGPIQRLLDKLTNRDFSLLVLAAALLDRWAWLLVAIAVGTQLFWVSLAVLRARSGRTAA